MANEQAAAGSPEEIILGSSDHVRVVRRASSESDSLSFVDDGSVATSVYRVAQVIFRSGLSTAEQVREISGRGVGMDAVRSFLEREGGDIVIRLLEQSATGQRKREKDESADDAPFDTVIRVPDKVHRIAQRGASPGEGARFLVDLSDGEA